MKFGQIATLDSAGATLAHPVKLPGEVLSKGMIISEAQAMSIARSGVELVTAARLELNDLHENPAATRLAEAALSENLVLAEATTGRVNVFAGADGLFTACREVVDAVNGIDPAITLACLGDGTAVSRGDLVATFKIIPFGVPEERINDACAIMRASSPFTVTRFAPHSVTLVATELPTLKPLTMDKTKRLLVHRLKRYEAELSREVRVSHSEPAVTRALIDASAEPSRLPRLIVVFGASAVADDLDILPQAIRGAGGTVIRVGMPVDPGNLLVLGAIGNTSVIGAPGCARSPAENGFDWILRRIMAGLPPTSTEMGRMGVGGLLLKRQTDSKRIGLITADRTSPPQKDSQSDLVRGDRVSTLTAIGL